MFGRFFSKNDSFANPSYGLDISDESIKFVLFTATKQGLRLKKYGEHKISPGIIESGEIKDTKGLTEILNSLRRQDGIKSARMSLPAEQAYILKDSFISIAAVEPEAQAIYRAVIKKGDLGTYMIVDFGEKHTGIHIVSKGAVMSSSVVDVGGITLTNMIQMRFNLSFREAEEIKKTYGLQRNMANQEISATLLSGASLLRDAIEKLFLYWQMGKDEHGKNNPPIKKIILCGGDSNLIGLSEYLSVSLRNNVEMANVWINVLDTKNEVPGISLKETFSFTTAIGLALGNFERD